MTYPEGRQPLGADDMAKMHPSTWEAEAKALRALVQELEAALRECEKSMDVMGGYDGRFTLRKVVRAALQKQEGE